MAKAELNNSKEKRSFRSAQEYPFGTLCEGLNGGFIYCWLQCEYLS